MKVIPDNAQAIGKRQRQEDSFAFSNFNDPDTFLLKGYLAIVADGMGGMSNGKEASQLAVLAFLECYQNSDDTFDTPELLQNCVQYANEKVRNTAIEKNLEDKMGSTLIAASIKKDALYWVSVGDSRIYLYRNPELIQLTEDHQYAKFLYREVLDGNMTKAEADSHPQKNALTSFLGLPFLSEIDMNVKPLTLERGDTILLCSDGLHGFVTDEEIAKILQENRAQAAQALMDHVLEKKHPQQDNVTIATLTYFPESNQELQPLNTVEETARKQSFFKKSIIAFVIIFVFIFIGVIAFFTLKPASPEKWTFPNMDWNLFNQEKNVEKENEEGGPS